MQKISTAVFVAVIIVLAFSLEVTGFEWAVIAMLGLIAAASATEYAIILARYRHEVG